MIEDVDFQSRIVRARDECVTGTEACSHDTDLGVALLLEPIYAAANVDDALPRGIDGAAHVGGYCVVGAVQLRGHSRVVVGHADAQPGDSEHIPDYAESVVTDRVR